jgi:MFS family permease
MAGHWSDLLGRKRLYLLGALLTAAFGFVYFTLLNTAVPGWMFVTIVLSYVPRDLMYGPQAALIAECFPARLRYSGCSLGYQLASVIAGEPSAADRDGVARGVWVGLCDRRLHPFLRDRQHRRDGFAAGNRDISGEDA